MTRVVHVQKVSGISGSEAHLLSLLPRLRERGWDARMLMLHEREPGARAFADELSGRGVPLEEIPLARDLDPVAFTRLAGRLSRLRPSVLHTHLVHGDVYGQVAGALARIPARISTKHGFNEFRARPGFGWADRAVARLAHAQIAISRGLARYLSDVEGFRDDAFEVVHYGIEASPDWGPYEGDDPRLLCVGRLIPIKGHSVLLRAFAEARRERPELRLDLAGKGPLEGELRALARELDVEDSVRILGHVAPIAPAIESALAVVVPSLGEGFGMVALEAMERGRAVVASAVGGLPELVEAGVSGLLVPPGEVEPLRAALVELSADLDRARSLGAAGRGRAVELFGADRCVERIELVYRSALDGR